MKKTIHIALIFVAAWMFVSTVQARGADWTIDKAHSSIYFGIRHIYATVRGSFDEFGGKIQFDPADLGRSRFDFTVAIKSINTDNAKRDEHLLSNDFFDAEKYPEMTFQSSSIKHLGGDRYAVEGILTIKDVSRTATIPFTYFGSKTNPFDPKQLVAGFEAHLTIDRIVYHVGSGKYFHMGALGKDVTVLITLEATRDK